MNKQFKVTDAHLKLAQRMYVRWEDCEFGAPSIDCKRPYGNSSVVSDILEILGFPIPEEVPESLSDYATNLHAEMETALQIFLCTQSFSVGTYEKTDEYGARSWKKIK
jgi:hypothetical protein